MVSTEKIETMSRLYGTHRLDDQHKLSLRKDDQAELDHNFYVDCLKPLEVINLLLLLLFLSQTGTNATILRRYKLCWSFARRKSNVLYT